MLSKIFQSAGIGNVGAEPFADIRQIMLKIEKPADLLFMAGGSRELFGFR